LAPAPSTIATKALSRYRLPASHAPKSAPVPAGKSPCTEKMTRK
jgi:hypothetical protein